jgi:hypothetical protein
MSAQRRLSKRKIGVLIVLAGVLGIIFWYRQPPPAIAPNPQLERPVAPTTETSPSPQPAPVEKTVTMQPVTEPAPLAPKPKVQSQAPTVKPPKEPLHDPDARDALALVGMDPAAEQYWMAAIYDTSLPDNEREDLMEDLNETGFADPGNLTADDLALIVNRLAIIDAVLANADDFMTPHLLEAQKDLVNMFGKASQH